MTEMTINVPDELAEKLHPLRDRVSELLERGMRTLAIEQESNIDADEQKILEVLASNPSPADILALKPSAPLQARASQLLAASKEGIISRQDEAELERILMLERLVRIAKANAYKQLNTALYRSADTFLPPSH